MSPVQCFLLEPTDYARRWLRRYAGGKHGESPPPCPVLGYMHDGRISLARRVRVRLAKDGTYAIPPMRLPSHSDRRWPKVCACGYRFRACDTWQVFSQRMYRRSDTGAEVALTDAPPGAIWRAEWYEDVWPGPDGRSYVCETPGGNWFIDGPASNCTRPDDWKLPAGDPGRHHCWIRHGDPPHFTVDKNGRTCAAGAGSIQSGKYHGFLQNGVLT